MNKKAETWEEAIGRIEEKLKAHQQENSENGRNISSEQKKSIRTSGIPPRYQLKGLDEYDSKKQPKAYQAAAGFIYPGKSLLLCGTPGTGKTHLACSILKGISYEKRLEGAFYIVPELLSEMNERAQNGGSKIGIIKEVCDNDVIVLDDLTDTNLTEAKKENLFLLLNRLELYGRAVIITSNMLPNELERFSPQIHSRITGMCEIVVMVGEDMRKTISS